MLDEITVMDLFVFGLFPPRTYHVLGHALETARRCLILSGYPETRLNADDEAALLLAAVCHDAVYEKGRSDNETLSGVFARALGADLGISPGATPRR